MALLDILGLGGPDNVTQTTTQAPPAYLEPYLRQAADYAQQLFMGGPQQYYPGNTVVPFSPQTNQALNLQQNRALAGSGVVDAAQGFTTDLLGGNSPLAAMSMGGENPYLDATFDRAAAGVNRSLDSVLARSGRDVNANTGARASQLNDLATNIYGGAYESDANRRLSAASTLGNQQLTAAGQAIPLAREDYFDIGQLGQVGSAVEQQAGNIQGDNVNRFNFAQNAPYEALNRYLGALSGAPYGGTTSSSQPVYNNPLSNLMGLGLGFGTMFGSGGMFPGLFGSTPGDIA